MDTLIAVIIAYLFGSISCAVLTCKLMKLPDPRTEGSNNPGATNVLRIGGKKAAIITLIGDMLKGAIPVLVAIAYGFDSFSLSLIALAAFLGHLYPVFFGFKGGKGVATAFGCITALAWPVGLLLALTWFAVAFCLRYSSLAALIAAIMAPFYMWYFTQWNYTVMAIAISALLIFRHRRNIRNLMAGKESKIGKK